MASDKRPFDPEAFKRFLHNLIVLEGPADLSITQKIAIMEHALACLRYHERQIDKQVSLEAFLRGHLLIDHAQLRYFAETHAGPYDVGVSPINLQPLLLMFLLLYHREEYRVYDIITRFIQKIYDQLTVVDFKRTETGVLRCFTNTRFAAATLREFGLLRFTRREAYKTWILSLPGFVVAAVFLGETGLSFRREPSTLGSRLHPEITRVCTSITDYTRFVRILEDLCLPDVDVFSTFDNVLRQAYTLLAAYWRELNTPQESAKALKEISASCISALDATPEIDAFCREFSKSINIERLLSEVDFPPADPEALL